MSKSSSPKPNPLPRSISRLFPTVKIVQDAKDAIELSVNRKDCKEATKMDPTNCAMARAARRELKADAAIIGISTSYIIKGDTATRYATPESVKREIVSFDRHSDFAPGDYYLTPKADTEKLGAKHTYRRPEHEGGSGNGKKARRKVHESVRVRVLAKGSDRR
jgi:hypothetical protein